MEPLATPSHPDAGPWADADVKELTHGGMAEDEGSWYIYVCKLRSIFPRQCMDPDMGSNVLWLEATRSSC